MNIMDWFRAKRDVGGQQAEERPGNPQLQNEEQADQGLSPSFFEQFGRHILEQRFSPSDLVSLRFGEKPDRNKSIVYSTMARCVTLICGVAAQIICNGGLKIVDRTGTAVKNRRTEKILEVIEDSPDMGYNSGFTFIEDAMADYALDGNSLIAPKKGPTFRGLTLERYRPYDAVIVHGNGGTRAYQAMRADIDFEGSNTTDIIPQREMIHCRWPQLLRYGYTRTARNGFAASPVDILGEALGIGLASDRYISGWFAKGPRAKLHVNYKTPEGMTRPTPEQRVELAEYIDQAIKRYGSFTTFDADSKMLSDTPQDSEVQTLREYTVQDVARYFGVPLPLLSVSIRQWGAAVNEQVSKIGYRWGMKMHIDRLLSAMKLRLLMPGEHFRPNPGELTRADIEGISQFIMAVGGDAQRERILQIPEIREYIGFDMYPQDDYIPKNSEGAQMFRQVTEQKDGTFAYVDADGTVRKLAHV